MLTKFQTSIRGFISRLVNFRGLRKCGYAIDFIHEGNIVIRLPKNSWFEVVTGRGEMLSRNISYLHRPNSEALLRRLIFGLYANESISAERSIVDIGCWISDNSVVWGKLLSDGASVFAIDPSPENLSYGRKVAELNNVSNVKFIEAVCADIDGENVDFVGELSHASFEKRPEGGTMVATTLDSIIEKEGSPTIGLLHVDVEGLEISVLKGASGIIENDMPIVSFEQHISREDISEVTDFLRTYGYRIFMVNEVLPGCSLDCRNFLAFDSRKPIPDIAEFDQRIAADMGIYSAVVGGSLVEMKL